MTDASTPKNVTKVCPIMSSAISWTDRGGKRYHDLARAPCLRGECELFDLKKFCCGLKREVS